MVISVAAFFSSPSSHDAYQALLLKKTPTLVLSFSSHPPNPSYFLKCFWWKSHYGSEK